MTDRIVHGLSVDLEDWYALVARRLYGEDRAPSDRVVVGTRRLLDLFDARGVRATFFVLGSVAEAFPDLVREVAARGHEIGTHGHTHRRVDQLDPRTFREELRISREAIERASGVTAHGHRAPEFSVSRSTLWALDVLAEEGFRYDSSVFPVRHPRYGIPDAPLGPHTVQTPFGEIFELPLATYRLAGRRLPAAGGGYLRFFPFSFVDGAFRQAEDSRRAAVLYLHPYEFDPEPLVMRAPHLRGRLFVRAQNAFRERAAARLPVLLERHRFGPLAGIIGA